MPNRKTREEKRQGGDYYPPYAKNTADELLQTPIAMSNRCTTLNGYTDPE